MEHLKRKIALGIFALLVIAAPLLFGAVDRQYQLWLVALFGVGMAFAPLRFPNLSPLAKKVCIFWIALLVLKEFAPWRLFGAVKWRTTLTQSFDIAFPWTHNPSPATAFDLLLVIAVAALWFLWVRTLAADADNRTLMFWSLFASAGITGVVCLVTIHPANPHSIFNLRPDNDWTGYGPFPNRNHTACFLAMGAVIGSGCLTNAVRHKKQLRAVVGFVLLLVVIVALLLSKSRGGLVALVAGLVAYAAFVICKARNRAAMFSVAGGALVFVVLCAAFGGSVISRFHAAGEGEIPTNIRWQIWGNTLSMWKDAPLFGHGLGTFPQVFPLYQALNLEEQTVGHPESSWLLWLAELGLIPLLVAVGAGAVFIVKNVRDTFDKKQGFFLRAAGFSAVGVLLVHAIFDVPAHRWGAAGFALAILAVTCPYSSRDEKKVLLGGKLALVPLGIAAFWLLPFVTSFPSWSPASLEKAIGPQQSLISEERLEKELKWFPLSAPLHYCIGLHLLATSTSIHSAWEHFRIADRLVPSSWYYPASEASASRRYSAGMTFHFWSLAIERSGHRAGEVFFMAWRDTAAFPSAKAFWSNYVDANPRLMLSYLRLQPNADGAYYFQRWWNERAFADDLAQFEIDDFYAAAAKYGNAASFNEWMRRHPAQEATDYLRWAALLHYWKFDADAWKLLAPRTAEPGYPTTPIKETQGDLEAKLFVDQDNAVLAQTLARVYATSGQPDKEREVVADVAKGPNAPSWFLQKAAFLEAGSGHYEEAVAFLLRDQNESGNQEIRN